MRILIFIFFTLILINSAAGQSRSLDFYLENAITNSPAIQEQQNLLSNSELQKDIVEAGLKHPLVYGTADYLYAPTFGNIGFDNAVTNGGLYSALVNIDYPLITGKKIRIRKEDADASGQKAAFQQQLIAHKLRRSVTNQYIATYQDGAQLAYLEDVIRLLNRQKNTLQELTQQGLARITDLRQIEIEIQKLGVDKKSAANSYRNNLAGLNTLSGLTDSSQTVLKKPQLVMDDRTVQPSQFNRQFRLDSLQLALQQQVSELKYQPSLTLYGNTGLNTTRFSGLDNNYGFSAGLRFSIPIYNGNQKSITRQQTKLSTSSVGAFYRQFQKQRQNNLISLRNQLQQVKEQLNMLADQINRYEQLLDTYRQELSKGELTIIEYLTVLRNYSDARNRRVQVQGNRLNLINAYNYWNW